MKINVGPSIIHEQKRVGGCPLAAVQQCGARWEQVRGCLLRSAKLETACCAPAFSVTDFWLWK